MKKKYEVKKTVFEVGAEGRYLVMKRRERKREKIREAERK